MEMFFDTETSGFVNKNLAIDDKRQAWPCQLAAILSNDRGIVMSMSIIIKAGDRYMNPHAERVHGISVEIANAFGYSEHDAMQMFMHMFRCSSMVICHNYNFDSSIIKLSLERCGYASEIPIFEAKPFYCTMRESTPILKLPKSRGNGYKFPKLDELHRFLFNWDFQGAHDAMTDVTITRKCYYELLNKYFNSEEKVEDA
jgi:DNA polymerase III epsilon subunit-like protein